jgi:lysozyme
VSPEQIIARVIPLLERFEGLRLRPYLCPAGVPTIGLGSTRYLDGRPVRLTDPAITREHAYLLAREQILRDYLPAVLKLCPGVDTEARAAALVDFAYNLGSGNLKASTLRRRVNAGDWPAAQRELRKWVRGGGKVLPGLVLRREAEAALVEGSGR